MKILPAQILVMSLMILPLLAAVAADESSAYLQISSEHKSEAVDFKGVRHRASDYRGFPPWVNDQVKTVAPDYPREERRLEHQGVCRLQLMLDVKTGAPSKITLLKSTGFKTLDNCAARAFQRWRWKPGKWKEVDTDVTFVIEEPRPLPPGAIRIPNR